VNRPRYALKNFPARRTCRLGGELFGSHKKEKIMKRCALILTTIALFTSPVAFNAMAQPGVPGLPPATEPGVIPPAPAPGTVPGAVDTQASTTITVSRTFTNEPNAITIIGSATSEQEKQAIGAKVQEAAPGKVVNNQLTVAGQGIVEPSGAERPSDKSPSEKEDDDSKAKDDAASPEQTDQKDQN